MNAFAALLGAVLGYLAAKILRLYRADPDPQEKT